MISTPVFVMGLKRKGYKATETAKHLRKFFNNVKIVYGLDIKKNKEIKSNQVVLLNVKQILENNQNLKGLIIAEDDVRITDPNALSKENLSDKIVRLVYRKIEKRPPPSIRKVVGAQLVYIPQNKFNAVINLKEGHFDLQLSKYIPERVPKSVGIEYIYPEQRVKGISVGMTSTHTKEKAQQKLSIEYDNTPINNKRYQK
tara:strand:+ start:80 stop:679 length:600 start_codon:yes stop_codon:yes gene_type:complete